MVDGIYIHIPFCLNKCNYCDFLSFKSTDEMRKKYVDYLIAEINLYPLYEYDTVYLGGGTPSLLNLEDIERIVGALNIKEGAEVTLEVNPKTVDKKKLQGLKNIGINRLSIGIQTFDEKMLKVLGRMHTSNDAIETYQNAREVGFDNISLDLMFSLPNQSFEGVKKDLGKLLELCPEHFSIYSLIWEEGTPFFRKLEQGIYQETENELEAKMYEYIIETAKKNGYIHYEISNFSKPNYEARHNSKYWENREYVGVGIGASGYVEDKRYKNCVQILKYYDNIDRGVLPIMESETVDTEMYESYKYMLGFRLLLKGVVPSEKYLAKFMELEKKGYLKREEDRYLLTHKGIMFTNDVLGEFV